MDNSLTTSNTGTLIWDNNTGMSYTTVTSSAHNIKTSHDTEISYQRKKGINPRLYFKYLKKKFTTLQFRTFERRIKKLQEYAEEVEQNGQIALSEKVFNQAVIAARESEVYSLGYKLAIHKEDVDKFKYKIKTGNVKYTSLKNFTHPIPEENANEIKDALNKKVFDDIMIVHYIPEDAQDNGYEKTEEEKEKDPIAFGLIDGSDRWFFITDWIDEYCDLTFDEILDELDLSEKDITLSKLPDNFIK